MHTLRIAALTALLVISGARTLAAQPDSTWRDHGRAADAARAAGRWGDYRHHLTVAETEVGAHPRMALGLARAAARLGDTAAAFGHLRRLAAMGIAHDLAADADLAPLRASPAWAEIASRVAANGSAVGSPEPVFALADAQALAEDLAWDGARRRWLVSSVHRGTVVAVDEGGAATTFIPAGAGRWALMGLAVDSARGRLWVTTAALPHGPAARADSGRAAILRFDLATGSLQRRYDLPRDSVARSPGDIALAPNGDVFIGDSRSGAVYMVRQRRDSLETLLPPGLLRSAQQPAVLPDGFRIAAPDYTRGIALVDRLTGGMRFLTPAPDVALNGIDGLIADGNDLIAIQNGVQPHRVVRLTMDRDQWSITRAEVLLRDAATLREPTHGVIRDGWLFLIANSGWDLFGDDGKLTAGARPVPPRVVRVPLR